MFVKTQEEYLSVLKMAKLQGFTWARVNHLNPVEIPIPNILNFYSSKMVTCRDNENIKSELETWKQKAADAEKEFNAKIYDRDFSDALKAALDDVKFSSEAAKKAVMTEIKESGLKLKDGKILGLSDLIGQIKERDASAFVDEQSEKAKQQAARFTTPGTGRSTGGTGIMTKDDIMKIKDPSERQAAIAQNLNLFGKGE